MARIIETNLTVVDDLTGEKIASPTDATTVSFSYRGVDYETDLGENSARRMDEAMETFIKGARRVDKRASNKARKARTGRARSTEPRKIREWAAARGITVSPRGRIDEDLVRAYHAELLDSGSGRMPV